MNEPIIPPADGWQQQGLCRQGDPDLFFPEKGDQTAVSEAKKICNLCPVQTECGTWGILYELDGVWGGTSRNERQQLRAKLGIRLATPGGQYQRAAARRIQALAMIADGTDVNTITRELDIDRRSIYRYLEQARTAAA